MVLFGMVIVLLKKNMRIIRINLFISIFISCLFTQDTFSIIAVDTNANEVGSAGASCIGGSIIISDIHPGLGAIHTQSWWNPNNQNNASNLMQQGFSPEEIIDWLIENDTQNNPLIRQYGVVDNIQGGRSAAYTGENCYDYKNHILGENYSIQGNILLGHSVLDSMEFRFNSTSGSLARRLMSALQGAKIPGADTRCLDEGISSLSAFIRVAKPDDNEILFLDLNVNNITYIIDPIDSLQILFDIWYENNPDYILGDVNSDTIINVLDIIQIVNFILGYIEPDPIQNLAADFDQNMIIDVLDLIQIVNVILNNNIN